MKRKILIALAALHLLYITLVNITGTYGLYCEFYNLKADFPPATGAAILLNTTPCKYYGRYTGAETGYGFFGMNVKSNGLLLGECNGNKLSPEFISYETSLRFFSLSSSVTDDWLKPEPVKDSSQGYNNLILKNIAVTLFQKNHCADSSIILSYNIINFPSLSDLKQGAPQKYELMKLITMRYSIH